MSHNFYFVYYENDNEMFVVCNTHTKIITIIPYEEWTIIRHKFEMLAGYDRNHDGLIKYSEDFVRWVKELYN